MGHPRWTGLDEKIGDVLATALSAVRYAVPNHDTNRSRWPSHLLWKLVTSKLKGDLSEMSCGVVPSRVKQVMRAHLQETIAKQIIGSAVTFSVAAGIADEIEYDLPESMALLVKKFMRDHPDRFEEKRARVRERYDFEEEPQPDGPT